MGRRATPGRKAAKMRRRKPKRSSAAATASQSNLSVRNLQERLKGQARELEGARDEHATLADVLRIISNSPGELEAVFQTILTNAVRICGAKLGDLYLREADGFRMAASHNAPPAYIEDARVSRCYDRRRTHRWAASLLRNSSSKSPTSRPYRRTSRAIRLFVRQSISLAIARCLWSRCSKMMS